MNVRLVDNKINLNNRVSLFPASADNTEIMIATRLCFHLLPAQARDLPCFIAVRIETTKGVTPSGAAPLCDYTGNLISSRGFIICLIVTLFFSSEIIVPE